MMHSSLLLVVSALLLLSGGVRCGCTDGGGGGCGPPVGAKWDRWDMAASTYTYCYHGCVVDWLVNNTAPLGLNKYAGVVGVDHYWTHQGMPCVDGKPQEFVKQDALTLKWKAQFPDMKMLQYRILSAVNYDMVIQDKIQSDPNAVVRWHHPKNGSSCPSGFSGTCQSGDVCWNGKSACFNDPTRINNKANKCGFHISAAAYNWSNPALADWFLEDVVKPTLVHADGIWLDGIGPDNGAYMCGGVCCGYGATNSPLDQAEIDSHCKGQTDATTKVQKYLIANGGWEAQKCFDYKGGHELVTQADSPAACASKLQHWAEFGADHSKYNVRARPSTAPPPPHHVGIGPLAVSCLTPDAFGWLAVCGCLRQSHGRSRRVQRHEHRGHGGRVHAHAWPALAILHWPQRRERREKLPSL